MSTLSELVLQVHRRIWYPVHVALGLESRGVILPEEFAPSLSDCGRRNRRRRQRAQRRRPTTAS